ncbi:MAG: Loki-CTERM sorting domain-containing protein [Promethearchaeota archaeon]
MYSVFFLLLLICGVSFGMLLTPSTQLQGNSDVSNPKSSAGEITIITPENKTYTTSDSGYYPATYGFENDKAGDNPEYFTTDEAGGEINIVDEVDGHKNVMGLFDEAGGVWPICYNTFDTPQTYGTYEYWVRTTDASNFQGLRLYYGAIIDTNVMVDFVIRAEKFQYYYNSAWHDVTDCVDNQWYHIEIAFECTTGGYRGLNQYKFKVWIDGIDYGECGYWYNRPNGGSIQFMGGSNLAKNLYVDAIGFSWDPHYTIGDNLNEGLLLSYENLTTLDYQGYSLDGQANRTMFGNTTIPMPSDGSYNIRVYGNNTGGTMYESNLRYFTVYTAPPEITINSPTPSQTIGTTAPSYDISITGLYDSIWYTLDGGTTNLTASSLAGTINQAAWTALADGIITIDFYANNSAGMEDTSQVMVIKDSSDEPSPTPPGIPGYDLYLLLGALSIISALIIRKRVKP